MYITVVALSIILFKILRFVTIDNDRVPNLKFVCYGFSYLTVVHIKRTKYVCVILYDSYILSVLSFMIN